MYYEIKPRGIVFLFSIRYNGDNLIVSNLGGVAKNQCWRASVNSDLYYSLFTGSPFAGDLLWEGICVFNMIVGVPKEVKNNENRVAMVLDGVHDHDIVQMKNKVIIEAGAGIGSGITDEDYVKAGAAVYVDKAALFDEADIIMKIKEPLQYEHYSFHEGQTLLTCHQ